MSGKARFKVRQSAVEHPCRCGSGGGIYRIPAESRRCNVNGIVDSSDSLLILQYTVHLFICIFEISVTMHSLG